MESLHSSSASSSPKLSPTTSLAGSMVSMKTEDHNELYDHRQHVDSLPVTDLEAAPAAEPRHLHRPVVERTLEYAIVDEDDSDEDAASTSIHHQQDGRHPHHQLRSSPIQNSNARPSRLAHSIPHQHQLFTDNRRRSSAGENKPTSRRASKVQADPKLKNSKSRANSTSTVSSVHPIALLSKTLTHKSGSENEQGPVTATVSAPAPRRASFDSEDSQMSRESQETEEDVCFPMSPQLHTRINGIDFDELEEFANEQRLQYSDVYMADNLKNAAMGSSSTATSFSSAALKYTPKLSGSSSSSNKDNVIVNNRGEKQNYHNAKDQGISFGTNKVESDYPMQDFSKEDGSDGGIEAEKNTPHGNNPDFVNNMPFSGNYECPNRFSFFCSDSEETMHATDIPSLVKPGETFYELFRGGEATWWLDCSCPTDDEMRCIAKSFGIHPLTAEDVRMQETREKVELFKSYYFVCFHTFENDKESEDFLEPINVYIVVFRSGVLTFHFGPLSHCASVRRRVRQLRDYVNVNSDWLCYALIDDITDSFAPVIQSIEYEADMIEDSVYTTHAIDFATILKRIGDSRRKTMTLMRLLSGKADVIKMFAKRCQDEANGIGPALTSHINIANLQAEENNKAQYNGKVNFQSIPQTAQPRGDIALYLGDIQDHLLTMYQNLLAYEKIFSRSHTNYLAQLQVESFYSNNRVTEMLGKVTMIGTMLVPLNVITGLFGMNVTVPGEAGSIAWWFGILGVLILLAICSWALASYWVARIDVPTSLTETTTSGAKSIITSLLPRGSRGSRAYRNGNRRNNTTSRSVASLPSKYSRYD